MAQEYCPYKKCNVEIGREKISAGSLEDVDAEIPGRYYCTGNDFRCENANQLCVKTENRISLGNEEGRLHAGERKAGEK